MESSSSGSAKARQGSGVAGGGGADTFDIPGKGAPIERLKRWRVSTSSSSFLYLVLSDASELRRVLGGFGKC
jgi:hypothetical protein